MIQRLDIISLKTLFYSEDSVCNLLHIPTYQRPYTWQTKTVNTLFNDIIEAYHSDIEQERLGTIILYNQNNNKYEIVDGQQRVITLLVLLHLLDENSEVAKNLHLPAENYSKIRIYNTYKILQNKIKKITTDKTKLLTFIKEKCTVALIVTDDLSEAFQFFDSQNSRGKSLQPHDLLKAYHLREMDNDSIEDKVNINQEWMKISEKNLKNFFSIYLYPIIMWSRKNNGLYYSSNNIDIFKGISNNNKFNYAIYHKASNQYVTMFNEQGYYKINLANKLNQFQLNQPLIAGRNFFYYVIHYYELLNKIRRTIKHIYTKEEIPYSRTGDIYVKNLFEAVLLFFADRFGYNELTEERINVMYSWSYILRIKLSSVYEKSINKHALARHGHCNIFYRINNMISPNEILDIEINKPDKPNKQNHIIQKIKEINNWE